MPNPPDLTTDQRSIADECDRLKAMLLEKNRAYGSSAFQPIRIFSRADSIEQIRVRLDDKLSRIARGDPNALGEDAELDLLGYLVLLRVARRRLQERAERPSPLDHVHGAQTLEEPRLRDQIEAVRYKVHGRLRDLPNGGRSDSPSDLATNVLGIVADLLDPEES